jgi:hypothetical protein
LLAVSDLADAVSSQMFLTVAANDASPPYLVYTLLSNVPFHSFSGSPDEDVSVEISLYGAASLGSNVLWGHNQKLLDGLDRQRLTVDGFSAHAWCVDRGVESHEGDEVIRISTQWVIAASPE